MQSLYIDNRDGFGPRDFTKFLLDRDQFFRHTKNEPQLFDLTVINTDSAASTHYVDLVRKTSGLIGYWRLGESGGTVAADTSGKGITGTYTGGVTIAQPGALSDGTYAAKFDGIDDYVDVTNASLRLTGAISAEAWVKPVTIAGTDRTIIRCGTAADMMWWLALDTNGKLQAGHHNGTTYELPTTASPVATAGGDWVHVVMTRAADGKTYKLYANGALLLSTATTGTPVAAATQAVRIGMSATQQFNGSIDEVAVYNVELSLATIQAHYAARLDTGAPNSEWVVPKRGAFVKFIDDRWDSRHTAVENGVLFTGYITEDPDPVFLGVKGGKKVWSYALKCTSEEFLANSKRLPTKTYVNKTRGFIIKDLLLDMFKGSSPFPFNMSGVIDGGTEQLYQVDTNQKWAEVVAAFAQADGFSYWITDSYVYYGPEDVVTTYSDPLYLLTIDEFDPRFNATNLDMKRVSRDIVNDITVLGLDEPTDIVREHFVSDGYQGAHNLAFDPYGLEASSLVADDFTGDLDTTIWQEVDLPANYIQPFNGALNIVGGPGDPGAAVARTVYLLARRPIEMSGVIEFRDGEIYFPPTPTGTGYIGGLYQDTTLSNNQLWNGWKLDINTNSIQALRPGGVVAATYAFLRTRHYVLRRTIQVDRQLSTQSYTQLSTGSSYSISNATDPVRVFMSWTVDEINNDDVNNVYTTSTLLAQYETTTTVPAYLLYAAAVPNDCHYVTNFLNVRRPQQAVLKVDGKEQQLGSYLDGAKATLQSDNGKGKLAWYQIPGPPTSLTTYANTVLGETTNSVPQEGCMAYWRLGDTGTTVIDSSGRGHNGTAFNATTGVSGALNSDGDSALGFNGTSTYVTGTGFQTTPAAAGSFEAWFKTSSGTGLVNTIYSTRTTAGTGEFYSVYNGQVLFGNNVGGQVTSVKSGLNDGRWHHVVVTYKNGGGVNTSLYIDGVLDQSLAFTRSATSTANTWYLGRDLFVETAVPGQVGFFNGTLDEIAIYYGTELTAAQVAKHYARAIAANPSVITVPKAGSKIALTYYRKRAARARLRSTDSINTERERYRDDGIRQKVIRADEITPSPRTSEECLALAQAVLYDSARPRYEGSYDFETVTATPTELLFWPRPGDLINCTMDLPDGDALNELLSLQTVDSEFLGKDAYRIKLGFGPVNRLDIVIRNLILKRRSSVDDPIINDSETDSLETLTLGYPYPDDLRDAEVDIASITATQFTVNLAGAGIPADVVNYEVREDDTGWGKPNYIARFRAASHVFTRVKRDLQYFIRPYNASNLYARKSAFIRVAAPVANTFQMTGVTGDLNPTRVRVNIPIPRDPDYAGIQLRQTNATGPILYQGNGDQHQVIATGVTVLLSAGLMTVDVPNTAAATSSTVWVNSYNLLNLFGTPQTTTISTVAAGSFSPQGYAGTNYTATGGGSWTVEAGDVSAQDFSLNNNTVVAMFDLRNTTVGGVVSALNIAIPYTALKSTSAYCVLLDNGTRVSGTMEITAGTAVVIVKRADNANFAASTNATTVTGQILLQI